MAATVHRITKVNADGKYCEIWLDPSREGKGSVSWDVAPKWDEVNRVVEESGLFNHILNHGYVGLRLIIEPAAHGNYRLVALSTSPQPEEDGS